MCEVARRMNYHRNTILYHVKKIKENTGLDPLNIDDLVKLRNDGWISVESELPKTNGTYNVTRYIDGHFISDSAYFDGQNTWHSDNRVADTNKGGEKMLRKILQELILIRKELQAIRSDLEPFQKVAESNKKIVANIISAQN